MCIIAHMHARRVWHLRSYKCCFVGFETVDWLCAEGHASDTDSALALGNALLDAGLMHHVTYEHRFKDKELFYRWGVESTLTGWRFGARP